MAKESGLVSMERIFLRVMTKILKNFRVFAR